MLCCPCTSNNGINLDPSSYLKKHAMKKQYALMIIALGLGTSAYAQWINFEDETDDRIIVSNVFDNSDPDAIDDMEKDFAVGDFDNDGFDDLVVVRKLPFSVVGRRTDLLFMNRNGVLVDETDLFAPEFLTTPTDARDILPIDVDNDGWLDLIGVNTFEDEPNLFMNRGNDGEGNWLGFIDESEARLPSLPLNPLQLCGVAVGDVNNDGSDDIYMISYFDTNNGTSAPINDFLLINDGTGNFTNESEARLGSLRTSSFGTAVEFHDFDNDGDLDILKNLGLAPQAPLGMGAFILFNDGTGNFENFDALPTDVAYMITAGDLNEDGLFDFYVADDFRDYTISITSVVPDESVTTSLQLINSNRVLDFGGNLKLADLDNDGDLDVGMSSADVDLPPCETGFLRSFLILENQDDASGNIVHPFGNIENPWNISTHDHDYIDLNNDGLLDMILGTCDGYRVFIQDDSTLSVTNNSAIEDPISISPNPNNGIVNISFRGIQNPSVSTDVYDITGKLLTTFETDTSFSNTVRMDLRAYTHNAGVYFLKFTTQDSSITKRIIVR